MKTQLIFASLLLLVWGCTVSGQSTVDSIADSHIRANVPDDKDFENFLKRDLESYFRELKKKKKKKKSVVVEYELLRKAPTQSGTAFPKFYIWVMIKENGALLEDGAVKVAAMEKKRFEVLNFLARADIKQNVERVYQIFPRPVADKIKEKVVK
jgi:hypothetical protein